MVLQIGTISSLHSPFCSFRISPAFQQTKQGVCSILCGSRTKCLIWVITQEIPHHGCSILIRSLLPWRMCLVQPVPVTKTCIVSALVPESKQLLLGGSFGER